MCDESGARLSKRDGSESICEYVRKGYDADKVVGELALSLGLIDKFQPISPQELRLSTSIQEVMSCIS